MHPLNKHVDEEDKKDALIQGPLGGVQKMTVRNIRSYMQKVKTNDLCHDRKISNIKLQISFSYEKRSV